MHVVVVTPLIRGTVLESLSYFSSVAYPIGSFIEVPIRGKKQRAIVTEVREVSSAKTALKAATFSLRKLPVQENVAAVSAHLQATAHELAALYPASIGAILFALLPPDFRNGSQQYSSIPPVSHQEEAVPQILTARSDERIIAYEGHIRSTFAHGGSVLLVVPNATAATQVASRISQGISDRIITLTPSQTKKQRSAAYDALRDESSTKLIITTPSYAFVERADLQSVIVEQAASSHFISRERPYLDYRTALTTLARLAGRSILFGDTVHRTEEEALRRDEMYLTYGEEQKRLVFSAPLTVIQQSDRPKPEQPFELFSSELIKTVTRTLESKERVFFYAARRGLAPVIACIDCGNIFRCPDSGTPYSLLRTFEDGEEKRWFVSSASGRKVRAADVCEQCGSWRLRERGIGIQQVEDEWHALFPEHSVTVLDSTNAKTASAAQKIAKQFFAQPSGLLIGTQLALPFLAMGDIALSAIISLDAARNIPTWRADEGLFRLLLNLREHSTSEVIVQTRVEPDPLITYATRGALERFYDDEIALREMLSYPPFADFVLLTWSGSHASVKQTEEQIKEVLRHEVVQYYHSPNNTAEKRTRHALIRQPRGAVQGEALN
ncbi:hypothetical protein KC887_06885, partial [Candidatus Kaiserbacteria bacterium]|nr:hypothetical protein [Candidatus Kaiserbacteria bacterium]